MPRHSTSETECLLVLLMWYLVTESSYCSSDGVFNDNLALKQFSQQGSTDFFNTPHTNKWQSMYHSL